MQKVKSENLWLSCFDGNFVIGAPTASPSFGNVANYSHIVSTSFSGSGLIPSYTAGPFFGVDIEAAHSIATSDWSVLVGILYSKESESVKLPAFSAEYLAHDAANNPFYQIVTTANPNGITEKVAETGLQVPLLLRYEHHVGRHLLIGGSGGVLLSLMENRSYNTDASFNYEAVYYYSATNGIAQPTTDRSSKDAWYIVWNKVDSSLGFKPGNGPSQQTRSYFDSLAKRGYAVGLGVSPKTTSGTVAYKSSFGMLLRLQAAYEVNSRWSCLFGLSYSSVNFNYRNPPLSEPISQTVGGYNAMVTSMKSSSQSRIGVTLGMRFTLRKY